MHIFKCYCQYTESHIWSKLYKQVQIVCNKYLSYQHNSQRGAILTSYLTTLPAGNRRFNSDWSDPGLWVSSFLIGLTQGHSIRLMSACFILSRVSFEACLWSLSWWDALAHMLYVQWETAMITHACVYVVRGTNLCFVLFVSILVGSYSRKI